jgi:predicted Zn-dependent protease
MEAALLLQPESIEAQLGVASAQIDTGKFAEAARQLEPLAKAQPRNADLFDLLAQAYSGLGRKAEAQEAETRASFLRQHK